MLECFAGTNQGLIKALQPWNDVATLQWKFSTRVVVYYYFAKSLGIGRRAVAAGTSPRVCVARNDNYLEQMCSTSLRLKQFGIGKIKQNPRSWHSALVGWLLLTC
mmetsp:Transcript_10771/g.26038  ORF Transcript_10771/g.26038 Transcript_10771/m.26038 type:complete len:105 (-) Transcript_10771:173-487(-)